MFSLRHFVSTISLSVFSQSVPSNVQYLSVDELLNTIIWLPFQMAFDSFPIILLLALPTFYRWVNVKNSLPWPNPYSGDCCLATEPSATGSAPGLPSSKHTGLFSPFPVPCVRLSSGHWLLRGKWKARALPCIFLIGISLRIKESSSWFHHTHTWGSLAVRDQGQDAPAVV